MEALSLTRCCYLCSGDLVSLMQLSIFCMCASQETDKEKHVCSSRVTVLHAVPVVDLLLRRLHAHHRSAPSRASTTDDRQRLLPAAADPVLHDGRERARRSDPLLSSRHFKPPTLEKALRRRRLGPLHADVLEVQVRVATCRLVLESHRLAPAAGSVGAIDFVVALLPVGVAARALHAVDPQNEVLEAVRAQTC